MPAVDRRNGESTRRTRLDAEVARLSAATGLLELAALGAHKRLLVLVRTEAEVLHRLTGVLGATEEHGVAAGRRAHGELVEGDRLATSGLDTSAGRVSEAERSNAELGDLEQTVVVGDSTHDHDRLGGLAGLLGHTTLVAREVDHARHRDGRAVHLRHKQATKDRLVEARVRTARQEAVELHEQQQVRVLALGG